MLYILLQLLLLKQEVRMDLQEGELVLIALLKAGVKTNSYCGAKIPCLFV
jgi:ferredoxin